MQTNLSDWNLRGDVVLEEGFAVMVLPQDEALTVLGTDLILQDVTQQEVRNRIASGWRLFWSMRETLMNRQALVKERLKLFDCTVGSCVLWCCESWTPRTEELRLRQVARRAMHRRIVGVNRKPEEDYFDWIARATRHVENLSHSVGIRDWRDAHFAFKWSWAGHVARRPLCSWVWRVSTWRDSEWQAIALEGGGARPLRPSRRRWAKWEDAVRRFSSSHRFQWNLLAQDREGWVDLKESYTSWGRQESDMRE